MTNVSFLDKLIFTKHLSVMLKAGLPINDALDTLEDQSRSAGFRKILKSILFDVRNGQELNKALAKFPKIFDDFYVSLVKIGEQSGNLDENLTYLAEKLSKDNSLKKKIQGIMFYPAIVLALAAVVGLALSFFVLPKMVDLFKSLDVTLPLSTKILLWLAEFLKKYNFLILLVLGLSLILFRLVIATKKVKPLWHQFLLTIPLLGNFLQNVELTSFCRNLGVMLKGGLTLTSAFGVAAETTGNLIFKDYIIKLAEAIEKGKSLSEELTSKQYHFIPPLVQKMIAVGEKSGSLEEMFLYLSDFYEEETDVVAKNFATVLEPILLIVIGLVVAFVALSVISPIYQLTGSLSR